ncbi:hypothetical protein EVAR_50687_1 [Eumeta japonica]|uniref:Uncharacterized protein n=1 Tax=Eumeta variegata TaxID=151549 RepID=A0A4C1XPN0_EUMVA|nr:hypothetical protein EVAR_50687_1 [Eumeta japonica]
MLGLRARRWDMSHGVNTALQTLNKLSLYDFTTDFLEIWSEASQEGCCNESSHNSTFTRTQPTQPLRIRLKRLAYAEQVCG